MLGAGYQLQDRYRIVETLGGGGMGQIYLAHDTRLADKPCAVKEMIPDPHATPEEGEQAADQFHQEGAILAHLSHPNLPNVYDYFEERGNFYLIMDCVEGENLEKRLAQSPHGLDQETVVGWAGQLCDVLDHLHAQTPPVIFRDLKPSNAMITPDGILKLIDFGIARIFDPSKRTDTLKMGTAGYAPPEQYAGQGQTTPRSDIYALGATLHELLTGADPTARPFVFTPPRALKPSISPSLSSAIMRAVSLDPDERFSSAGEMKEALQKATQPRRLRLPAIQRRSGTGTRVMPEATAVPVPKNRAAEIGLGILRWLGRVALITAVTVIVVLAVLTIAATFALSNVVERGVASIDWGLVDSANPRFVLKEDEFQENVKQFLNFYALDAADEVKVNFIRPETAMISLQLFSYPITLEANVAALQGTPAITLKKMNDVPLYVVGGILSGGINRGFQKAWEGSPLRVSSLEVYNAALIVELESTR